MLKSQTTSTLASLFLCLISINLFNGCDRTSVSGQARESKFDVVLGGEVKQAVVAQSSLDLGFLNSNHFACICVNVKSIRQNPTLEDFPWDAILKPMQTAIGSENANLDSLDRLWLVFDRSGTDFGDPAAPSPIIYILDFQSAIDSDALQAAQQQQRDLAKPNSDQTNFEPVARMVTSTRVVIASEELATQIANNSDSTRRTPLSQQLAKLSFESDIEGAVTLTPIQDLIDQALTAAQAFGGDELKKWEQLPQSLQETTFQLSLSKSPTFVGKLLIDDPALMSSIEELFSASNGGQSTGGSMGMLGMLGNQPTNASMFETQSTSWLEKVGEEIQQQDLFSVSTQNQTLTMTLQRPPSLDPLIKTGLADISHQAEFSTRLEKLRQLADALKQYESEFGCLPPGGTIVDHPDGLPDQFNWRVGLARFAAPEVYASFDFSKPWDDPANLQAAEETPAIFAGSPGSARNRVLAWQVNATEKGLYSNDSNGAIKLDSIQDNKRSTAIVVEASLPVDYLWHAPESAALTDADQSGREDENGVLFVSASFNPKAVRKGSLKATLSIAGEEDVSQRDMILLPRR